MRPRRGWLIALCAVAGAAYAQDLFVSPAGNDVTGDGTPAAPFRTIQRAVEQAQPTGDRIRALPGTYNECVDAFSKSVAIVADEFITNTTNPDRTLTVIDGTGVCDATSSVPAPAVVLGNDSTLEGFTVVGGGASGVQAFGDVVITRNEIRDSAGFQGGGIYLYAAALYPGTHVAVISDNTIQNNTATVDGGGIFALAAAADDLRQQVQISRNIIRDNVAQGFPLSTTPYFVPGGFGGGISAYPNSTTLGQVEIAITENVIEGNTVEANSGSYGSYGGGVWAATLYGAGTETIRIEDNQVRSNTALNTGGGMSAWAQGYITSKHEVRVERNIVSANGADNGGGGLDLFLRALDLSDGSVQLRASSNEVTGNRGDGFFGGGGLAAYAALRRTSGPDNVLSVQGNTIRGNSTDTLGGGASILVLADSDPEGGAATAPASSLVRFERNLVAGNQATNLAGDGSGGGVAVDLRAFGEAVAEAELDFDTIASNAADLGGGGIDVFSLTDADTHGTAVGRSSLAVSNSIVASNTGFALGGPTPAGAPNLSIESAYNDFFGNTSGIYENTVFPFVVQTGNLFLDPLLDALSVPSVCSPTVDAADPTADFGLEPEPNGDRANQGHLGGTADAVQTLPDASDDRIVDGVDVLRIASAFASDAALTPARYFAPADLDGDLDVDGDDLAYVAAFFGRACP